MPQSGGFIGLLQIKKSNLEVLLQRHVQMAAEIKNLDTDLQMLVYENYNKFISATDTIKRYLLLLEDLLRFYVCDYSL